MCSAFRSVAGLLAFPGLLFCGSSRVLRICADPNNLPFSSESRDGLENRLASIVAGALDADIEYVWWSERKSFLKNSLNAGRCDAVMGVPTGVPDVLMTRPYYRSTYVTATRRDRKLNVRSLFDDTLDKFRIGVHVTGDDYSPPAQILARRGLTANIVGFSLFGSADEKNPALKLLEAVLSRDIDLAIVWGPFAGYFAKSHDQEVAIRPVSPSQYLGMPFTYDISIAVRKDEHILRDEIDKALAAKRAAVQQLLQQYGVPQVPEDQP